MRGRSDGRRVSEIWGESASGVLELAAPAGAFDTVGSIGLIAARPETAIGWRHALQRRMRDRLSVLTREQAMALQPGAGEAIPEIFVIECDLDGAGLGLRLMSALQDPCRNPAKRLLHDGGTRGLGPWRKWPMILALRT